MKFLILIKKYTDLYTVTLDENGFKVVPRLDTLSIIYIKNCIIVKKKRNEVGIGDLFFDCVGNGIMRLE